MLTIKVLGPGCANCRRVETVAREAVSSLGAAAEVIKVTDYAEIMQYPILHTPGLVINEQLVCSGRIPSVGDVTTWINTALEKK